MCSSDLRPPALPAPPLQAYFKGGLVKLEVGLCKGKKLYDKRADAAKKAAQMDIQRAMRARG